MAFTWLKDGAPVAAAGSAPAAPPTVSEVDAFSSLLTFSRLEAGHSGNYTCVAENRAGTDRYTAGLAVRGKRVDISRGDGEEEVMEPFFPTPNKSDP